MMTQAQKNNLKATREVMEIRMYESMTPEIKQHYKNVLDLIDEKIGACH
jgi:UPF0288 family protein (methanogenesis marker protein 3)